MSTNDNNEYPWIIDADEITYHREKAPKTPLGMDLALLVAARSEPQICTTNSGRTWINTPIRLPGVACFEPPVAEMYAALDEYRRFETSPVGKIS